MQQKKAILCIITAFLLVVSLLGTSVSAAEVPKAKYTLTCPDQIGTVKEVVNFPDYDIVNQEYEMILMPKGSDIIFTASETMIAAVTGVDKEDDIFLASYDGVPWMIDGEMELISSVEAGQTVTGTLTRSFYPYYMLYIADENDNVTRIFFKMVDKDEENTGNEPATEVPEPETPTTETPKTDVPDDWATEHIEMAISLELVPEDMQNNYKSNITRSDFCRLIINMIEVETGKYAEELLADREIEISGNPFNDTTDDFVINANALGIVAGKGAGKFDPNGSITREEAATMLKNAAQALEQEIESPEVTFADKANIAGWAMPAVGYVSSMGIMNGTGNNNFSPKGVYTRQQAYTTILKLFEVLE